jgi:hypothetical protein
MRTDGKALVPVCKIDNNELIYNNNFTAYSSNILTYG